MRKFFSLVELIVVMVIISIASGLIYYIFFLNRKAYDTQIARIDLWQEAQSIVERISSDVRRAYKIEGDTKSITLTFPGGGSKVYTFTSAGECKMTQGDNTIVLSHDIDYNNSCFHSSSSDDCSQDETISGNFLKLRLTLQKDIGGGRVKIETFTRIFCRNRNL